MKNYPFLTIHKLNLVIFILGSITYLQAQNKTDSFFYKTGWYWGIKGGPTINRPILTSGGSNVMAGPNGAALQRKEFQFHLGAEMGFYILHHNKNGTGWQTGFNYRYLQYLLKFQLRVDFAPDDTISTKINSSYIQFPLILNYYWEGCEKTIFFIGGGLYLERLIRQNIKVIEGKYGPRRISSFPGNYGGIIKGGALLPQKSSSFLISLKTTYDFLASYRVNDPDIKIFSLSLQFGYQF